MEIRDSLTESLSADAIFSFLQEANTLFPVPLSQKTDLRKYAEKIYERADYFFCLDRGKIVGLLAGYVEHSIDRIAYVSCLCVLPAYQGKGLASDLLASFIDRAAKQHLRAIHLYTHKDNAIAGKLYQHFGFDRWYLEGESRPDDIHLIKFLGKKSVLITAIGSFSADITIKNLKKYDCRVIGTDIYDKEWVADAYQVDTFYQVPKVVDAAAYKREILAICEQENISYILPSTDIEVDFFIRYRKLFDEKNICICLSPTDTLKLCRDKKLQQEFIREHIPAVNAIPTEHIRPGMECPYAFPVVCKLLNGRSSQGLHYIKTQTEWAYFVNNSDLTGYVVQPEIEGCIVAVDVVRQRDGSAAVVIPREELLRTLNGAGTSVKVYNDPKLKEQCISLADKFGVVGCVCFEFIKTADGIYYYLECNPRFSGGIEFSCIAGYDCILNHIRAVEGKDIELFEPKGEIYIARKYEEYVTKLKKA